MNYLVFALFILLCSASAFSASDFEYEFKSKDGRLFSGEVISRDVKAGTLKVRRTTDLKVFELHEELLTESSLEGLHVYMTKDLVPKVRVTSQRAYRKQSKEWKTSWGSYDENTDVRRAFIIEISSTNSFRKQVEVMWFWVTRDDRTRRRDIISQGSSKGYVGGGMVMTEAVSDSTEKDVLNLEALDMRYTDGSDILDLVVVVLDMDKQVIEVQATNGLAKKLALEEIASSSQ